MATFALHVLLSCRGFGASTRVALGIAGKGSALVLSPKVAAAAEGLPVFGGVGGSHISDVLKTSVALADAWEASLSGLSIIARLILVCVGVGAIIVFADVFVDQLRTASPMESSLLDWKLPQQYTLDASEPDADGEGLPDETDSKARR